MNNISKYINQGLTFILQHKFNIELNDLLHKNNTQYMLIYNNSILKILQQPHKHIHLQIIKKE